MAKLHISKIKTVALTISRPATKEEHFVYIAVANKALRYPSGATSKIVYIGQTKRGARRLAVSAAKRAEMLLDKNAIFGVNMLTYYIIVPGGKSGLKSWALLETALLSQFKSMFGSVPKGNVSGKGFVYNSPSVIKAHKYFTDKIIYDIVKYYSHIGE